MGGGREKLILLLGSRGLSISRLFCGLSYGRLHKPQNGKGACGNECGFHDMPGGSKTMGRGDVWAAVSCGWCC